MYDWSCGLDFADNQDYHHRCAEARLDDTGTARELWQLKNPHVRVLRLLSAAYSTYLKWFW